MEGQKDINGRTVAWVDVLDATAKPSLTLPIARLIALQEGKQYKIGVSPLAEGADLPRGRTGDTVFMYLYENRLTFRYGDRVELVDLQEDYTYNNGFFTLTYTGATQEINVTALKGGVGIPKNAYDKENDDLAFNATPEVTDVENPKAQKKDSLSRSISIVSLGGKMAFNIDPDSNDTTTIQLGPLSSLEGQDDGRNGYVFRIAGGKVTRGSKSRPGEEHHLVAGNTDLARGIYMADIEGGRLVITAINRNEPIVIRSGIVRSEVTKQDEPVVEEVGGFRKALTTVAPPQEQTEKAPEEPEYSVLYLENHSFGLRLHGRKIPVAEVFFRRGFVVIRRSSAPDHILSIDQTHRVPLGKDDGEIELAFVLYEGHYWVVTDRPIPRILPQAHLGAWPMDQAACDQIDDTLRSASLIQDESEPTLGAEDGESRGVILPHIKAAPHLTLVPFVYRQGDTIAPDDPNED